MRNKNLDQRVKDEAWKGIDQMQLQNSPNPLDMSIRHVCENTKGLRSLVEVYFKGVLVGWVKVSMSLDAKFEAKV